jgi:hypothetical protein
MSVEDWTVNCAQALTRRAVIIAICRDSPQFAGKNHKPAVEGCRLPAIRAYFDKAWLYWKEFGGNNGNVKSPNYFLSLSITDEQTQAIVSRAIRNAIPEASSFPA